MGSWIRSADTMQIDQYPPDRAPSRLAWAITASPFWFVIGSVLFGSQILGGLVALVGTFILSVGYVETASSSAKYVYEKAAGIALLICLGWFLLGLAILYAACGRLA